MPPIKALLIDLNGTLHVGKELTPRAAEGVEALRHMGMPFVFCSNNTKESEAKLLDKLRAMGLSVRQNELLTSLGACRSLVEKRNLRPYLLLSPAAREEFAHLPSTDPDAVILGLHPESFDYDHLNTAFRILKGEPLTSDNQSAKGESGKSETRKPVLIAPHTAAFHQAPDTPSFPAGLSLGIGAYVRALEEAAGVQAEIVGKPTRGFFERAIEMLRDIGGSGGTGVEELRAEDVEELRAEDVGIIGDDVRNDLGGGAKELGLRRVLVRTGKYRPGVEDDAKPDEVWDTFADYVDSLVAQGEAR